MPAHHDDRFKQRFWSGQELITFDGQGAWLGADAQSGAAADKGLKQGDVILEVAGKSVSTPADVRNMIASARTDGKRSVLVRLKSGDNTRFVALPVGKG